MKKGLIIAATAAVVFAGAYYAWNFWRPPVRSPVAETRYGGSNRRSTVSARMFGQL